MGIKILRAAALGALLALGSAGAAFAHHSFGAEFDQNKPITLEGSVIQFEWANPHSWIHIDVVNAQGQHEHWRVEGGAPSILLRKGWNRNTLPPGTKIVVHAYRSRDGDTRASAAEITLPGGHNLSLGNAQAEAAIERAKQEQAQKH